MGITGYILGLYWKIKWKLQGLYGDYRVYIGVKLG